jgi:hypothetical protein
VTVESPLRREAHGGFGERPGETDRQQCQHRAPGRLSLAAFADHGAGAAGEAPAIMLRPGNAGSNTAADHIEAVRLAQAQLPCRRRRRVLVRTDSGGGTHEFLAWLTRPARRLAYSVGMTITEDMQEAILKVPARAWTPAYDADGQVRPGAWVAEITGMLDLASWPEEMRVLVRKERPTPAPSCGSPTSAVRAARRPGTAPPPPGTV